MLKHLVSVAILVSAVAGVPVRAAAGDEAAIHDFIDRWNTAYTSLDSDTLAALQTPDFQMVDRFGHWIRPESPEAAHELWALTFKEIYRGKQGPARTIESIRFLAPQVAIVQARANHPNGVDLDDGTHIPPFWEINTYTLIRTDAGWRLALLNIHNQINPGTEGAGQHVPTIRTRPAN